MRLVGPGDGMRRRAFIAALGGAAAWPLAARSQTLPVIGYLHTLSATSGASTTAGFHRGLSEVGFTEGRNVAFEYRYAEGQIGRLPTLADDLVRRRVSVIAAMGGSRSALAAKGATATIPIVFTMGDADPVELGVVASLARPGGNVTGISLLGGMLSAKRLELLREIVPGAAKIGVLINPENRSVAAERKELETAITTGGQQAFVVPSGPSDDLESAMATFAQHQVDGLVVTADPIFTNRRTQIVELAARYRIPAIYQWNVFVTAGGLISYGTDLEDIFRQAGQYTGRVLKGEKPADLPVQQPTKFQLAINLNIAKSLGLTVPPSLLARADEVIE
jgi:putative tryptophan/tyrosine transport system substrate-binding protein